VAEEERRLAKEAKQMGNPTSGGVASGAGEAVNEVLRRHKKKGEKEILGKLPGGSRYDLRTKTYNNRLLQKLAMEAKYAREQEQDASRNNYGPQNPSSGSGRGLTTMPDDPASNLSSAGTSGESPSSTLTAPPDEESQLQLLSRVKEGVAENK